MIRLGWLRKIISSKNIIIFLLVLFALLLSGNFGKADYEWIGYGLVGQRFTNTHYNNYDLGISNVIDFLTNDSQILAISDYGWFFWNNGVINFYAQTQGWNNVSPGGGPLNYYVICDSLSSTGNFSSFSNCITYDYDPDIVNDILTQVSLNDDIYYGMADLYNWVAQNGTYFFGINVSNADKLILFMAGTFNSACQGGYNNGFGLPCYTNSFTSSITDSYDIISFPSSLAESSPIISHNPNIPDIPNVYEPISQVNSGDIINYYQNVRDFNEGDCFVGTWDLDSNDDEDFRYNNGYHIFYFFKNHYDITDEYYSLSDVGGFIDSLMYNYDTYYNYGNRYTNGDIVSVKDYDFDSHRTVETFSGFTNPFTNKPLVYETYPYFLNYYHRNFSRAYDGKDLASYCYYKLGFSSRSTGYNGNDFSGSYICGNGETCFVNTDDYGEAGNLVGNITSAQQYNWGVYTINSKNYQNSYTYLSGDIVINSESWDGTPLDYFSDDIPSDLDEKNFISSSFTRFRSVFEDIDLSDLGDELLGFLPTYIITFMLALMLFRFLQH